MNFQMFKLVLEKAEEPEIKLPTSAGSWIIFFSSLIAAVIEILRKVCINGRERERNSSRGSGSFVDKIGLGLGLK